MKNTNDPLEKLVSQTLDVLGIAYKCPDQDNKFGAKLDFYLPKVGIYIECKAWGSSRLHKQVEDVNNCIVLIGAKATKLFCGLLLTAKDNLLK